MNIRAHIRSIVLEGLLKLAKTTTKAIQVQIQVDDEDVADEVPLMQPQGVRFRPPAGSEAILVAVGGEGSQPVALAAMDRSTCPTDDIGEGEGGLYYAGVFRVFVDSGGVVHLGAKSGADFVALAQKVLDELDAIKTAFDAHTHTDSMSGATTAPTAPMPAPSSVAATKAKAT